MTKGVRIYNGIVYSINGIGKTGQIYEERKKKKKEKKREKGKKKNLDHFLIPDTRIK